MNNFNFKIVRIIGSKTIKCEKCGKRLRRKKTFWQTINPYNKNDNGEVKTRSEIQIELVKECDRWKLKSELCTCCTQESKTEGMK